MLFHPALIFGAVVVLVRAQAPGASSFVVPPKFPSSVFDRYYYGASPTQNPQPAIHDPVLNLVYPLNLTDLSTLPSNDNQDPPILPPPVGNISAAEGAAFVASALEEVLQIFAPGNAFGSACSSCVAALPIFKSLAFVVPDLTPAALVEFCEAGGLASADACYQDFGLYTEGAVWTQVCWSRSM